MYVLFLAERPPFDHTNQKSIFSGCRTYMNNMSRRFPFDQWTFMTASIRYKCPQNDYKNKERKRWREEKACVYLYCIKYYLPKHQWVRAFHYRVIQKFLWWLLIAFIILPLLEVILLLAYCPTIYALHDGLLSGIYICVINPIINAQRHA